MGRTVHKFNIPTKYLFISVFLYIFENPQIQVYMNIYPLSSNHNILWAKMTELNDFTVFGHK